VDFYVYRHLTPDPKAKRLGRWEDYLVAFVVRPDREVVRVELGPFGPLREAVEQWRQADSLRRKRPVRKKFDGSGDDDPDDPAVVLRDKLWLPVAKHLGGVETVLVSPDRDLSKLPFAALPGSKPGTYLIEEVAVAVLPVAQFLPDVVAPPPAVDPSLLVVGDVDYGADPGKPAAGAASRAGVRGDRGKGWDSLPATREEAASVVGSFGAAFPGGAAKVLRNAEPTEGAVRMLLGKHRWVHLATHGFFADPTIKSAAAGDSPGGVGVETERKAVTGQLPGLLSGVVLAGANRPPDVLSGGDDGILTAAEVATLDLSATEVVVLSACETGLGQSAGGEGVLGLQRAFQVAGCRTTVTSLWTVPDEATRKLMTRAYTNWWGGKKSKLEGLVEAQRWMLKEGQAGKNRTPPFSWAAFVLAGDWR
jgi:CHAT domain-containing protein